MTSYSEAQLSYSKAQLILESGEVFQGLACGAKKKTGGEVVFNTSHTGYQEILTDPSYAGQIVTMTYPLIGNYGTNPQDEESEKIFASGLIIKELSAIDSNFQSTGQLDAYLASHGVTGFAGIDTRRLVKILRIKGAQRGFISVGDMSEAELKESLLSVPSMEGSDWVSTVSQKNIRTITPDKTRFRIAAFDFGMKRNIERLLLERGCEIVAVPHSTKAEDVMSLSPDGIFLSNGPGDPAALHTIIENLKTLLSLNAQRKIPIFGICLGHQLLSIAFGAKTYKLKFGHHGSNHPVKDLKTGKIEITSQNHGFAVNPKSLPKQVEVTHRNLYDGTVEGIQHKSLPYFSVQYHPEGAPGPRDSVYLFDRFLDLIR